MAAVVAAACTIMIIGDMSPTSPVNNLSPVTGPMIVGAASVLALALLLRFSPWRRREGKPDSPERFKLQAAGALVILGWMLITELLGELNYRDITMPGSTPNVYNVNQAQSLAYILAAVLLGAAAIMAIRSDKKELSVAFSAVTFAIGLVAVFVGLGFGSLSGGSATNYWVSAELNLYGGLALILFTITTLFSFTFGCDAGPIGGLMSEWQEQKAEINRRAHARLMKALPDIFPSNVVSRALIRPFIPPTPRLAINSYWRDHPLRTDRLARALAMRSGQPVGWRRRCWKRRSASIRTTAKRSACSPLADAVRQIAAEPGAKFIAGGTNLIDLMKEEVERPSRLIDISRLPLNAVEATAAGGVRIGASEPTVRGHIDGTAPGDRIRACSHQPEVSSVSRPALSVPQ